MSEAQLVPRLSVGGQDYLLSEPEKAIRDMEPDIVDALEQSTREAISIVQACVRGGIIEATDPSRAKDLIREYQEGLKALDKHRTA